MFPSSKRANGRVVSNFIVQALQNKEITIYGDGSQTRSFCYVDNLIDGLIKLMESDDNFTGPVNLGNPYEFTIKDLAEKVIKLTDSSSKIIYQPLPENDPVRRQPDISMAQKMLEWEPTIQLDDGLKDTIKYFTKILSSNTLDNNQERNRRYVKKSMLESV